MGINMRGRIIKILSIVLTLCFGMLGLYSHTSAAILVPDKVKIGLLYGGTSVSSFNISAEKGLQLGFVKDDKFNLLYQELKNNKILLRKDSYFAGNNGTLKEYSPSDKTIPPGNKVGPFHVKIGGDMENLSEADQRIQNLKQAGVIAYPVYTGVWQVWTGFYTNGSSAQSDIDNILTQKLGQEVFGIIDGALSANRIVAETSSGNVAIVFDCTAGVFQIKPNDDNKPYISNLNGKNYRGDIEVRRVSGSDMTVINVVSLEEYLYGVVPSEIEASSHAEALKSQAVAARTYTLSSIGKHSKYFFDLCSTTDCQVYGGYDKEASATNKAINATKGKKLTYGGKLVQAFFFSSSGGRTENCENVWVANIPYLKSVEDKYESGKSYNYNWKVTLTSDKIKSILKEKGYDIGDISDIKITKLTEAGRALEMVVNGTKGQKVFTKESCRIIFGLASQMFTITTDADVVAKGSTGKKIKMQVGVSQVMTSDGLKSIPQKNNPVTIIGKEGVKNSVSAVPNSYVFTGKGWGHAIGMSQEGAKGMALNGFGYEEILKHYYTGATIE